jgi:hypothetical protein
MEKRMKHLSTTTYVRPRNSIPEKFLLQNFKALKEKLEMREEIDKLTITTISRFFPL